MVVIETATPHYFYVCQEWFLKRVITCHYILSTRGLTHKHCSAGFVERYKAYELIQSVMLRERYPVIGRFVEEADILILQSTLEESQEVSQEEVVWLIESHDLACLIHVSVYYLISF